jgi:hypothetical protein
LQGKSKGKVKTLYFDIDGTVLDIGFGQPKSALANGQLETAIRRAGFQKLVCVGNIISVFHLASELGRSVDEVRAIFNLCGGSFSDESWFRQVVQLVPDPKRRAQHINFTEDWWYVDDMAEEYLKLEKMEELLTVHRNQRVFIPTPTGNGQDMLDWLFKKTLLINK